MLQIEGPIMHVARLDLAYLAPMPDPNTIPRTADDDRKRGATASARSAEVIAPVIGGWRGLKNPFLR